MSPPAQWAKARVLSPDFRRPHPAIKCCPGWPLRWWQRKPWGLEALLGHASPPRSKEAPCPSPSQWEKKLSGEPELSQPFRSNKASWLHGVSTSIWQTATEYLHLLQDKAWRGPKIPLSLWSKEARLLPRVSKEAEWEICNLTPHLTLTEWPPPSPNPAVSGWVASLRPVKIQYFTQIPKMCRISWKTTHHTKTSTEHYFHFLPF